MDDLGAGLVMAAYVAVQLGGTALLFYLLARRWQG